MLHDVCFNRRQYTHEGQRVSTDNIQTESADDDSFGGGAELPFALVKFSGDGFVAILPDVVTFCMFKGMFPGERYMVPCQNTAVEDSATLPTDIESHNIAQSRTASAEPHPLPPGHVACVVVRPAPVMLRLCDKGSLSK